MSKLSKNPVRLMNAALDSLVDYLLALELYKRCIKDNKKTKRNLKHFSSIKILDSLIPPKPRFRDSLDYHFFGKGEDNPVFDYWTSLMKEKMGIEK